MVQKGEQHDISSSIISAQQFINPQPSAALDVNDPSVSDDKVQEVRASPANTMEAKSSQIPGKQVCIEDGLDQTCQSWGSPKSPKILEHGKQEEQASEVPFRKARVSVRARSEAPLVSIN